MGFLPVGKPRPKEIPLGATNTQIDTRVKALELWRATASTLLSTMQSAAATLAARVLILESKPPAGAAEIAALGTRLTALEAKTCPQQSVIDALVADHIPD